MWLKKVMSLFFFLFANSVEARIIILAGTRQHLAFG
jgi:hypothetical protein